MQHTGLTFAGLLYMSCSCPLKPLLLGGFHQESVALVSGQCYGGLEQPAATGWWYRTAMTARSGHHQIRTPPSPNRSQKRIRSRGSLLVQQREWQLPVTCVEAQEIDGDTAGRGVAVPVVARPPGGPEVKVRGAATPSANAGSASDTVEGTCTPLCSDTRPQWGSHSEEPRR